VSYDAAVEESEASVTRGRSVLVAVLIVLAIAAAVFVVVIRGGGGTSDEEAIRAWLSSPTGGSAPPDAVRAVQVPACNLTGFRSGSYEVLSCEIETPYLLGLGLGRPALFGCFVISNGKVLRGGSGVKAVADCKAVRYDARTHGLIDVETGRHYPIETM
jgi:hypothetical protein